VEVALAELDYRPNHLARTLRTGKPNRIAILAHELGHMGPGRVVQGAIAECRAAGYVVEIVDFNGSDTESLRNSLDFIGHEPIAGILATAQTDGIRRVFEQYAINVPTLIDFRTSFLESLNTGVEGGSIAGDHLGELGHRSVSYLSGPEDWSVARDRLTGLETAMARFGGAVAHVQVGDWSPDSGYVAGTRFDPDRHGSAVFAANDHMAIGFVHALKERGLEVPGRVSVIGFDDIPEARYFTPALTSVRADFDAEGRCAAALLIAEIEGSPRPQVVLPLLELAPRDSTAPPMRN
jgi:LacI family transcriptional regulator